MPRTPIPLSLENILLGFLTAGPSHGYDLFKKLTHFKGIALVWHIKQGMVYAMLEKLEEQGLATATVVTGGTYLNRKEYSITPEGNKSFLRWVATAVEHGRDMRQEFLAKLYFARFQEEDLALRLISAQEKAAEGWLDKERAQYQGAAPDQGMERMIFQYRIMQTEAMLEWLTYCRQEIQASAAQKPTLIDELKPLAAD